MINIFLSDYIRNQCRFNFLFILWVPWKLDFQSLFFIENPQQYPTSIHQHEDKPVNAVNI